jgi:predicted nucleic acid-binding protein
MLAVGAVPMMICHSRGYIESEAVLEILYLVKMKDWPLAASEIIEAELLWIKDVEKLESVKSLYDEATEYLALTDNAKELAKQFQQYGIKEYDSLHLAVAESHGYDALLTTDDDSRRAAVKIALNIRIGNPVEWLLEELENA